MNKHSLSALIMLSFVSVSAYADQPTLTDAQKKQIEHGSYLALAGDCVACHTAPGGKTFAGGLPMASPIGNIYSTNITPDVKTGIGQYSLQDFDKAVRQGEAKDGHALYPAMPYPSFVKMSDADLNDLYLYFMHGVTPVEQANKDTDITWPLSIRWPLSVWSWIYVDEGVYQNDPSQTSEWNRGAYLVQGLGHCGSCHTPRGLGFQEKALDQNDSDYLAGGTLEGWHAPNLNGDPVNGLGKWSQRDIIDFLQKGHNEQTAAFGSMVDVIQNSTQHLNDNDLKAIAVYLKSLPSVNDSSAPKTNSATYQELSSGQANSPGAQLYLDNCAACHRSDGKGYKNTFPALDGNSVLNSDDPSSVIHIILAGGKAPVTAKAPTGLVMPDFGWRLNDQEVAELATFVRNAWSNKAPKVSKGQVEDIREIVDDSKK
jgi:mono/diheme cytochrome c family protein